MDQNGSKWINIGCLIIPESVQKIKVVISKGFLFRKRPNNSAIQQNAILTLGKPKGFFNKDLVNFKQFIVVIHTVKHLDKSFHIYTWYVKIFKLFLAWKNKQKLNLCLTASQRYRLSHINALHIIQSYKPKDKSMKFAQKNIETWRF